MKHRDMLPFRRTALAVAAALIAPAAAQNVWGGQSQQYCSNQNTGSDYSPVSDTANSYKACSDQCSSNYAFAIVQWQNCWCSDYIPADQGSTSDCNQSCPGYPADQCGNQDQGLFGYIALSKEPSGTAGGGSSSQASSTSAPTSSSERVSTSTVSTSSRDETTSSSFVAPSSTSSSSFFTSPATTSTSSDPSSEAFSSTTSSAAALTSSSQTSSQETTSFSSTPEPSSTSSSEPPITSSSTPPPSTTSTSSTPPPSTSTSSSSTYVAAVTSDTSSSSPIPTSATPSPVTSTRVVTISGEAVTETVTSTPMVVPDLQSSSNATSSSDGLSGGAIAGIVIGVLAFLALLALVIFLLWRRRQQKDPNNPHGYPEMASKSNPRPRRNVSVLSKVGLLARHQDPVDDDTAPSSAVGGHSARHSAYFGSAEPSSPLGPGSENSNSLYQMQSRRHRKPLVYDQRLNPSALFANADANGSRISMADNTDYSRPLDTLGGKLQVRNPDPRSSFESRM